MWFSEGPFARQVTKVLVRWFFDLVLSKLQNSAILVLEQMQKVGL